MQRKQEVHGALRVFVYPADELRQMVRDHAASAQACIDELTKTMPEDRPITDEMAAGSGFQSSREVFQAAIKSAETIRDEALFLADHVADGEHRLTAAELLAFKSAYGPLKIDQEKLRFAPAAATPVDMTAERRQSELIVAKPRIVLPPGVRA